MLEFCYSFLLIGLNIMKAKRLASHNNPVLQFASKFLTFFEESLFDLTSQSSYGNPLSRVEARVAAPFGAYGSAAGAAAASTGFLWIIIDTVTL
jgi:hypothetical protein